MSIGAKPTVTKSQNVVGAGMRPNIQISHTLNGRVKDYADANDMDLSEAYRLIIKTGLEELENNSNE